MDQVKNTMHLQGYSPMKQSSVVSIQEDGSTCLKHVGYASPKLTPKHGRSVKQSKRRTKTREETHLEFPPPPSFPPPEHYDLSDEYSADLIDNDVPNCKTDYRINDDLVRFRSADDQPPEGFWNSPIEAPWSYFLADDAKDSESKIVRDAWTYKDREPENVTNLDEPNEFWNSRSQQEVWALRNVESSTPYMERKNKVKKKSKKNKVNDEMDHVSEEIMLINKLREDFNCEEKNLKDFQGFRNEIWVSSASGKEEENTNCEKNQDSSSQIQIKKNHISNVLITHGNDEILDNFIENKPIYKTSNAQDSKYAIRLINDYSSSDCKNEIRSDENCDKCSQNNQGNRVNFVKENNVTVVSGNCNREEYRLNLKAEKEKNFYKQGSSGLAGDSPDVYSYAYYEPGPINKIIMSQEAKNYEQDRNSRYTYTTHYGTEENIYEEITEVSSNFKNHFSDNQSQKKYDMQPRHFHQGSLDSGKRVEKNYIRASRKYQSQLSLNQSIVEEEVREVQSTHRRVLGQLNLTMEEMLMPNSAKEKDGLKDVGDCKKEEDFGDDNHHTNQITDLDSGFSGSSETSASFYGGSNYVKSMVPFRRPDASRSSLSSNSKIYSRIPFKSKQMDDRIDYRSGSCCDQCCSVQSQYQFNGRRMSADQASCYAQSPNFAASYAGSPNVTKDIYNSFMDTSSRRNVTSAVKSLSFPRGMTAPTSSSFSKRTHGSGSGHSWAKRGWKKLAGLALGSTNKVNVLAVEE